MPHAKSWLIGKDSDAGRDWGQEEKRTTEDDMAGWHHWLDGRESKWTPGVGDGQGGLACCDSWGRKGSDTTEQTDLIWSDLTCPSGSSFKSLYIFSFWSNHFALSYSPGVKGSWCLSWYWPRQAKISAKLIPQKWTLTLTCKGNKATRQISTHLWRQSSFNYMVIFTERPLYARYWTKYWCTITRLNGQGAKSTVQKTDINQIIRKVYGLNYNSYTKCQTEIYGAMKAHNGEIRPLREVKTERS